MSPDSSYFTYTSVFGPGLILMVDGGVKYHLWGGRLPQLEARLRKLAPGARKSAGPRDLKRALDCYFEGGEVDFSRWTASQLKASEFAAAVYAEAGKIRWGQTTTYSDLARAIGKPGAQRAVGTALGRNPVPLFVPCHRVLAARGVGGWSGPAGLKDRLLELERA